MKVFFNATPSQLDEFGKNYQLIDTTLEGLGHELTSRWILDFNGPLFTLPRDKWKNHYKKMINSLFRSDVAVMEISVSSTSIGQLIQQSLIWKKPVIALKYQKQTSNIFLVGAGEVESKLLIVDYTDEDLKEQLSWAFESVQVWLESRFTLILPSNLRNQLDLIAKSETSRSEYIRKLIEKDVNRKSETKRK